MGFSPLASYMGVCACPMWMNAASFFFPQFYGWEITMRRTQKEDGARRGSGVGKMSSVSTHLQGISPRDLVERALKRRIAWCVCVCVLPLYRESLLCVSESYLVWLCECVREIERLVFCWEYFGFSPFWGTERSRSQGGNSIVKRSEWAVKAQICKEN